MARRHDQKPDKKHLTCSNCHKGECSKCVDVTRLLIGFEEPICLCKRRDHLGEPAAQQVRDPFTGSIHAPGLEVTNNGEVKRR